jgi:hypothetical protein
MSKEEFEDYCTRLEDRVIFGNLKNLQHGVGKQPSLTQEARKKRRESERYLESQRHSDRPQRERPSLYS